jgi:multidrug efflux system outer membrane protein
VRSPSLLLALGGSLLLAGCSTLGPDYKAPEAKAPAVFRNAAATPAEAAAPSAIEAWWSVYKDPVLDQLESRALAESPTLAGVAARVREARLRLGIARADRLPSATLSASSRLAGETSERTIPIPGHPVVYRDSGDSYRLAADAGYELDLWGRVRRSVEGAEAQFASTLADERAARLSLGADIALNYCSLRSLDAEARVLDRTLAQRRDSISVLRARVDAGYTTELDVQRAAADLATVEAEAADLARRREQLANALTVLVGADVSGLLAPAEANALPLPPSITPGLPLEVLRRRPDIASAEATLHARMAEIGVAEAARYPTLRLTGGAGFESNDLGEILKRPAQFWQLGPSLSMPLFDGGRAKANAAAAVERAEAARADHRAKTLGALREVEDALVDLRQQSTQADALLRATTAAQTAVDLANLRYTKGLTNYLEVLDSQRTLLQLERSSTQLSGSRLASSVRLIRSLGGAW